jgi:ferric-dicitrate binding protein FerR (iron transport regulator)
MTHDALTSEPAFAEALDRYLAGVATANDAMRVEQWLRDDPHALVVVEELRALRPGVSASAVFDVQTLASRIETAIDETKSGHNAPSVYPVSRLWYRRDANLPSPVRRWSTIAGIGTCAIVAAFAGRSLFQEQSSAHVTHYATAAGERQQITFRDGTRVFLGPATRLTATLDDRNGGAAVRVVGEAAFQVAHRARSPFIVTTEQSVVRVIGTTFTVRQYATERVARITVANGRVEVRPAVGRGALALILSAGMNGIAGDSGTRLSDAVNTSDVAAWTQGTLVFRKVPVREVLRDVSRAYAVDVRVADSVLAGRLMTWRFPAATHSLMSALDELSVLLNVRVVRSGDIITLTPGRRASAKPAERAIPSIKEIQYGR